MIDTYKLQECVEKINLQATWDSSPAPLKLIWQWAKQDHITFQEFRELIDYVHCQGLLDKETA